MNQILAPSLLLLQFLVNICRRGILNQILNLILTVEEHLVEFTIQLLDQWLKHFDLAGDLLRQLHKLRLHLLDSFGFLEILLL
mgnify:CR=1 FL=1